MRSLSKGYRLMGNVFFDSCDTNERKKMNTMNDLSINFMNASSALIKYCINSTQDMIDSISQKNNMYKVAGFLEHFIVSSECKAILTQLEHDIETLKKLLKHLIQKLPEEFKMTTEKEKEVQKNSQTKKDSEMLIWELMNEFKRRKMKSRRTR